MFKDAASKEDYMNMTATKIDQQLQAVLSTAHSNNQHASHQLSSSSTINTMIPTPGMRHSGNSLNSAISVDNYMRNTSGPSMVVQPTSTGSLLPAANGSVGVGSIASFNASNGPITNEYRQSPVNVAHGSGGSSMMPSSGISQESSQMIPTPGLNNPQPMSVNSDYPHGGGLSSFDSNVLSQQPQQKQYAGSQNSRILQSLGGQRGVGMRSNMQHKTSTYGLPNGVVSSGLGLIGSMQAMNGLEGADGYSRAAYGSSPKALQHFDRHHHQQAVPTSSCPQLLPLAGHGYPNASTVNNSQKINSMSLHSKPKTNHPLLSQHTGLQSSQLPSQVKPQLFDCSQHMDFQTSQTAQEHLLHSQQSMQHFQHQQFQQLHQPNEKIVQHQRQQHSQDPHNQQLLAKIDSLRQSSTSSNFGGQPIQEPGMETFDDLLPQATHQLHLSEFQNQYQHTTITSNLSKGDQFLGQFSGSQDFQTSFSQNSQHMLHVQPATKSQSGFNHLLNVTQTDALQQQQWRPQLQQKSQMTDNLLFEQQLPEEFHQRISGLGEAQQPQISSGGCMPVHVSAMQSVGIPQSSSGLTCGLNPTQKRNYHNQTRWLLFLLHSRRCSAPEGLCREVNCIKVQKLWLHMDRCNSQQCGYSRCYQSKQLLWHYRNCRVVACPVCIPVRTFVATHRKPQNFPLSSAVAELQKNESWTTIRTTSSDSLISKNDSASTETSDFPESSPKRLKAQQSFPPVVPKREEYSTSFPRTKPSNPSLDRQNQCSEQVDLIIPSKSEVAEANIDSSMATGKGHLHMFGDSEYELSKNPHDGRHDVEPLLLNEIDGHAKEETVLVEKDLNQDKGAVKQETNVTQADTVAGSKSGKPKIKGVSLTELFTPEQIRDHIVSLRQWVGQSKAKAERNQAMESSMSENSCQLCVVERLSFEPPPIYCTPCGARIKRNTMYYTMGSGDTRTHPHLHLFLTPNTNRRSPTVSLKLPKPSHHKRSPAALSSSDGHDRPLNPYPPQKKPQRSAFIIHLVASAVFLIGLRARACPVLPSPAPITQPQDVTGSSDDEEFRAAFERWKSKTYALTVPLRIVALRGSIPPSWIKDFFQVQGKRLKFGSDYRGTLESIFSELSAASNKGVVDSNSTMSADLVSVGDSWLDLLVKDRLIEPIRNVDEHDWFNGLSDKWKVYLRRNDEGKLDPNGYIWGAPYRWGTMVIAYKNDKFRKHKLTPIKDWDDLWRTELAGKISMIDSPREVIGAVLKHMGASYNTEDIESHVAGGKEAVLHNLTTLQKQVRLFDSVNYLKAFAAGDAWVAVGWSSDVLPAAKRMSNVAVIVPKSGASLWADIWAVPAASRLPSDQIGGRVRGPSPLIHQWIEFCLQTARGLPFQEQVIPGASPFALEHVSIESTRASRKGMPELETNLIYGVPPPEILSKCEFLEPLSEKAAEDYRWLISCMQKPCPGWIKSVLQDAFSAIRTWRLTLWFMQ